MLSLLQFLYWSFQYLVLSESTYICLTVETSIILLPITFVMNCILILLVCNSANIAGRSDWDDGRWEWEDTPRRDSSSYSSSRRHEPSPSPMFIGASPDVRLVSPWLGGHTPRSGNVLCHC